MRSRGRQAFACGTYEWRKRPPGQQTMRIVWKRMLAHGRCFSRQRETYPRADSWPLMSVLREQTPQTVSNHQRLRWRRTVSTADGQEALTLFCECESCPGNLGAHLLWWRRNTKSISRQHFKTINSLQKCLIPPPGSIL